MNCRRLIFWFAFVVYWCDGRGHDADHSRQRPLSEILETCSSDDITCHSMASQEKLARDAILALHRQLDDDANGNIDLSETGDFLREDLKLDSGYDTRQKVFHYNDDMHISEKELLDAWMRSEVRNWTIEQTTEWLTINVELPQYVKNFIENRVSGRSLPRLAAEMHFVSSLGIKDPIHKQKIALKAMDVVLFGPPKDSQHYWKDLTLITLIIGGSIGIYYALQQNKKFRRHLMRMNRDMEGLQNAEKALESLQKELEEAKIAQESVVSAKEDLEKRLQTADISALHNSDSNLEILQLRGEVDMLRNELLRVNGELNDRCWSAPPSLQHWLQFTHEIEYKAFNRKKQSAEKQLQQAREACEKLKKKRSSLVGAFVSTHGKSIDEVDRSIVEARTSLNEVTQELQERVHRWKQIEMLCGFSIINNTGLQSLESTLYRNINGRAFGLRGRMSSADELDDECSSIYSPSAGGADFGLPRWKEMDSSGSEASKQEDDSISEPSKPAVNFLVGSDIPDEKPERPEKPFRLLASPKSNSNSNIVVSSGGSRAVTPTSSGMTRSVSQDTNLQEISGKPKSAYSDTALEASSKIKPIRPKTIKEQSSPTSLEDDLYSTDSSVVDDENKKKKRKLFGFGKKGKAKD